MTDNQVLVFCEKCIYSYFYLYVTEFNTVDISPSRNEINIIKFLLSSLKFEEQLRKKKKNDVGQ